MGSDVFVGVSPWADLVKRRTGHLICYLETPPLSGRYRGQRYVWHYVYTEDVLVEVCPPELDVSLHFQATEIIHFTGSSKKRINFIVFSHDLKWDHIYVCSHYIDIHKGNNFNWFLIGGKEKTFLGCTAKCNCTSPSGILLEMKINLRSMRVGSRAEMVKLLSTSSLAERNESKGNVEMIRGKTLRLTCMNVLPWSVYSWKGVECWPVRLLMSSQPELEGDVSLNVNLRDLTWSSSDWRTQHRWEMEPPSFDQDWRLGWRYWHWTGMRGELDWDIYMRTPLLVISGEH